MTFNSKKAKKKNLSALVLDPPALIMSFGLGFFADIMHIQNNSNVLEFHPIVFILKKKKKNQKGLLFFFLHCNP